MAANPTGFLTALQNGVAAINSLVQILTTVTTTSSGVITIHLTQVSS